jgi:hypothetical protein
MTVVLQPSRLSSPPWRLCRMSQFTLDWKVSSNLLLHTDHSASVAPRPSILGYRHPALFSRLRIRRHKLETLDNRNGRHGLYSRLTYYCFTERTSSGLLRLQNQQWQQKPYISTHGLCVVLYCCIDRTLVSIFANAEAICGTSFTIPSTDFVPCIHITSQTKYQRRSYVCAIVPNPFSI